MRCRSSFQWITSTSGDFKAPFRRSLTRTSLFCAWMFPNRGLGTRELIKPVDVAHGHFSKTTQMRQGSKTPRPWFRSCQPSSNQSQVEPNGTKLRSPIVGCLSGKNVALFNQSRHTILTGQHRQWSPWLPVLRIRLILIMLCATAAVSQHHPR